MLKFALLFIYFSALLGEVHTAIFDQIQKWHNIQQQLVDLYSQYAQISNDKIHDDREFFNIQQQLGAIYFAQKRYQLGFGTALLPSERAVHDYVRKKTFLALKTQELVPLYKKYVLVYQKKYSNGEFERIQRLINKLEALNALHFKLFEQHKQEHKMKDWTDTSKIEKISSIQQFVKELPIGKQDKQANQLLNWITPVAGIRESSLKTTWMPLAGAIVLCPDDGTVTSINCIEDAIVIFIKQHHFTYVITGLHRCCVDIGDNLRQGEPLGFCADKEPRLVELQLWRDDVALDPEPYHKVIQL